MSKNSQIFKIKISHLDSCVIESNLYLGKYRIRRAKKI